MQDSTANMTQYRLLFAVSEYRPFGGMQRTMLRVAQACQQRGHTVEIITRRWHGDKPTAIQVHELGQLAWSNHAKNNKWAQQVLDYRMAAQYDCLVGFNKMRGLDIYYGGDPCFAARFRQNKPSWYKFMPRYRNFLAQETAVFAQGLATDILLIALQEKAKFIHHYATEDKRFHLLPPGINRDLLAQTSTKAEMLRAQLGLTSTSNMILLVGSSFKTKGVDRAIQALTALPAELCTKSYLVIVGKGKSKTLLDLANNLKVADQVKFTGPQENVADYYRAADLLIHPAYTENTGTTLLEAMVCGLPVLTTANCGYASHIEKARAGLVVAEPFEQTQLNQHLASMLSSTELSQWAQQGKHYAETEDLYSLIDKAAEVIIAKAAEQSNRQAAS